MPPPPDPTLPDDIIEEIFLRLPPDEPECLVRASLTSKLWLGRLTAPRFHARYSEFHGAPPMLGFFYSSPYILEEPPFVSTTKFRVRIADPGNTWYSAQEDAWDCRHGRILLGRCFLSPEELAVLDPITGCWRELVAPEHYTPFGAAVLCAVNGCDHRACHGGPSRVVIVSLDGSAGAGYIAIAYETLLETGERSSPHSHPPQWSKPCSGLQLGPDASIKRVPPVLIKDALYFKLACDDDQLGILQYDLCSKRLALIDAPLAEEDILMRMEDGSLGFAHLDGLILNLWSRKMGSNGVGSWTECRVIDFKELLPFPMETPTLVGSVEGGDIIFVTMKLGTYQINLKSLEWKNISKIRVFNTLVPYMSFYYPQGRANPYDAAH